MLCLFGCYITLHYIRHPLLFTHTVNLPNNFPQRHSHADGKQLLLTPRHTYILTGIHTYLHTSILTDKLDAFATTYIVHKKNRASTRDEMILSRLSPSLHGHATHADQLKWRQIHITRGVTSTRLSHLKKTTGPGNETGIGLPRNSFSIVVVLTLRIAIKGATTTESERPLLTSFLSLLFLADRFLLWRGDMESDREALSTVSPTCGPPWLFLLPLSRYRCSVSCWRL